MNKSILPSAQQDLVVPLQVYHTSIRLIEEALSDVEYLGEDATIETVLELLQHCLFLSMGKIMIADEGKLRLLYGYETPEFKKQITYGYDEGLVGRAFKTGRVVTAFDLAHDPEYKGKFTPPDQLPYRSPGFTAVPIKLAGGQCVGVLAVNHGGRNDIERAEAVAVLQKTADLLAPLLVCH